MPKMSKMLFPSEMAINVQDENEVCKVCYKAFDIYSIGPCNHVVCHECAARMRILSNDKRCPFCRVSLARIIFSHEKLTYNELDRKYRKEIVMSRRYGIAFCTSEVKKAFFKLAEHRCPICVKRTFSTLVLYIKHVTKKHDLYFCELCIKNINHFSCEIQWFKSDELDFHYIYGVIGEFRQRGHMPCRFCGVNFFTKIKLMNHMTTSYYFCHFCLAKELYCFFKKFDELKEHYSEFHYLCDLGRCAKKLRYGLFEYILQYETHIERVHHIDRVKIHPRSMRKLVMDINVDSSNKTTSVIVRDITLYKTYPVPSKLIVQTMNLDLNDKVDFPPLNSAKAGAGAMQSVQLIPEEANINDAAINFKIQAPVDSTVAIDRLNSYVDDAQWHTNQATGSAKPTFAELFRKPYNAHAAVPFYEEPLYDFDVVDVPRVPILEDDNCEICGYVHGMNGVD